MFQVERIHSLEGPDLLPYKTLRDNRNTGARIFS